MPAEGLDLLEWHLGERRYLFTVLGVALFLDQISIAIEDRAYLREHPKVFWMYFIPVSAFGLALVAAMAISRRLWAHWLAIVALFGTAYAG